MIAAAGLGAGPKRRARALAGLLAALCLCTPAAADGTGTSTAEDAGVCHVAYVQAQRLQRQAQLRAAQHQALVCGQDACSATVRSDCAEWLEAIERALPSIVIDARGADSATLTNVRVEADGELLTERLDGRAIELDPGEHRLRFSHAGLMIERHALIREGEKYRRFDVHFDPAPSGSVTTQPTQAALASDPTAKGDVSKAVVSEPIPVASYVLGGVGLLGVGLFGAFATRGYLSERHLRETCERACAQRDVTEVRRHYLVADVGLGVGVVALAGAFAVWHWRAAGYGGDEAAVGEAYRLELGPGSVSWSGAF